MKVIMQLTTKPRGCFSRAKIIVSRVPVSPHGKVTYHSSGGHLPYDKWTHSGFTICDWGYADTPPRPKQQAAGRHLLKQNKVQTRQSRADLSDI